MKKSISRTQMKKIHLFLDLDRYAKHTHTLDSTHHFTAGRIEEASTLEL